MRLGEALALTAMLGSALKTEGKFILQTKTDGALDFLVADLRFAGQLRGYANFDKADAVLAKAQGRGDQGALLGKGHVAMTIDPAATRTATRASSPRARAAGARRPIPISANPSNCRPSSGWPWRATTGPAAGRRRAAWRWRAGGLMIQQLPREGGKRSPEREARRCRPGGRGR